VPPDRVHSGIHARWSGSQGYADSNTTLAINVPATASQLKFWTFYNLEDGYDWGYALVSTDNGATWTSLITTAANGSGTTAVDPIGTAGAVGGNKKYPNGFTGTSGLPPTFSGQSVVAPVYTEHTADFTLYAGKSILLRFAYTSDPATNLDGIYVDDVRILNLTGTVLFSDNMETAGSWQSGGTPGFSWVTATTN